MGQAGARVVEDTVGRGDIHKGATANAKKKKYIYIHIYRKFNKTGENQGTLELLRFQTFREMNCENSKGNLERESGKYFPGLSCSPGAPTWTGVSGVWFGPFAM